METAFSGWPGLFPYLILDKLCPGRTFLLVFFFFSISHDCSEIGPQYPELEQYVDCIFQPKPIDKHLVYISTNECVSKNLYSFRQC